MNEAASDIARRTVCIVLITVFVVASILGMLFTYALISYTNDFNKTHAVPTFQQSAHWNAIQRTYTIYVWDAS